MTQKTTKLIPFNGWRWARAVARQLPFAASEHTRRTSSSSASRKLRPINVIIPVYRGVHETARCLNSVIAAGLAENSYITVINDASPEAEMVPLLDRFLMHPRVTVLHNPSNRGFVGTVNRGMAFRPEADVVLLNSDTEVPSGWLERIQQCAYTARDIGTVTPFSNNATICSYPRFCADNSLPAGYTVAKLDSLFRNANGEKVVDIPTAVGFCMYIRRECLDETGLFDEERFGRGYGEENDFCMRASKRGWRHVLCGDLFVYHAGAVSFANEHDERASNALKLVIDRYPRYPAIIHRHIEKDPARILRHRVDLLRLLNDTRTVVLLVTHRLAGGVAKHERELAGLFDETVNFLRLAPGVRGQIEISWFKHDEGLRLHFSLPRDWDEVVSFLKYVGVRRVHFHHLLDLPADIKALPSALGVPYDFTVHDYFPICPRITLTGEKNEYCGEPAEAECNACLKNAPKFQRDIRKWRSEHETFLAGADRVMAPSNDVVSRFQRHTTLRNLVCAPHADLIGDETPALAPLSLPEGDRLRIVVIGALSAIKGADLLEAAAIDAKNRNLLLDFHLIGYAWRGLVTEPRSRLTISGQYRDEELLKLLIDAKPNLIWFPALWPETYSYTLSAALKVGLPIVAPDLGAFPERLANRAWSWICPWKQSAYDWNNFFVGLREKHFVTATPPAWSAKLTPNGNYRWIDTYLNFDRKDSPEIVDPLAAVDFAERFTRPRLTQRRKISIAARGFMLRIGLTVRSLPMLAGLVRRMPLSWQYRIRYWLVK